MAGVNCVHYIEKKDCTARFATGAMREIPNWKLNQVVQATQAGLCRRGPLFLLLWTQPWSNDCSDAQSSWWPIYATESLVASLHKTGLTFPKMTITSPKSYLFRLINRYDASLGALWQLMVSKHENEWENEVLWAVGVMRVYCLKNYPFCEILYSYMHMT